MAAGPRDGNDQRVVPDTGIAGAPGRKIGHGVGPADGDEPGLGRLPAVAASAHPVGGVGERHAAHTMLAGERHGPFHGLISIERAGAEPTIPTLERSTGGHQLRLSVNVDNSTLNLGDEAWKAVQSMRVNPVAGGFGKELGATAGTLGFESQLQQHAQQIIEEFLIGDSKHEF